MRNNIANPFPECIKKIGVCSPASRPDGRKLAAYEKILESLGIGLVIAPHTLGRGGEKYFSASKDKRTDDLNNLICDDSIDLIMASRGGYGSARLLPEIDFGSLGKNGKVIAGYSDITAIHLAMTAKSAGVPLASVMAADFRRIFENETAFTSFRRAVHSAFGLCGGFEKLCKLKHISGAGTLSGKIIAANLTLLANILSTPYMPSLEGKVLLIEDVGELPRKIESHLDALLLSGKLENCSGILFGDFASCGDRNSLKRIIRRFASVTEIPVYAGVLFGHCFPSYAFACGEECRIERSALYIRGLLQA